MPEDLTIHRADTQGTPLPQTRCPVCRGRINAALEPPDLLRRPPQPEDYTLCIHCCTVLVFQADMTLRVPTAQDLAALTPEHWVKLAEAKRLLRRVPLKLRTR